MAAAHVTCPHAGHSGAADPWARAVVVGPASTWPHCCGAVLTLFFRRVAELWHPVPAAAAQNGLHSAIGVARWLVRAITSNPVVSCRIRCVRRAAGALSP